MRIPAANLFLLAGLLTLAAGCSHLDIAASADPNRVVTGKVAFSGQLPAGAEVYVRVIDTSANETNRLPAATDLPVGDRGRLQVPDERVLGEQKIILPSAARDTLPYRIEFQADDALLRHGLNLDARISYDGRVRYRTLNAHAVTLNSVRFPQEIAVQPVQ